MSGKLVTTYKRSMSARSSLVDMSGANSLFGTIGSGHPILSRMNFIPLDGSSNTISLVGGDNGDSNPRWIGLSSHSMQYWAYVYCSPLATVIDRLSEADTNGILRFADEDLIPVKNPRKIPRLARMLKLLKKPNPWQTWEEFEGEQVSLSKIFGYCPVWAINGGLEDKTWSSALINLNPMRVTPTVDETASYYNGSPHIKSWRFNYNGDTYEIPAEDIFIVKDSFVSQFDKYGLPLSKVNGLDFSVSNICAAMEADNVLLKKKGPLGVFSFDPGKDMAGSTPYDPEAKDNLQKDLMRYGLTIGQLQHVISALPVRYEAISYNAKDLTTKETIRQSIDIICDRMGYPAELMSGKNATYENRNSSEKWLYNNNVIPFSLRRMSVYNQFFGFDEVRMIKDFSDLPVLQEDIVKAGEASLAEATGMEIEWKNGMITWNQWQVARGRDSVSGMDIYYPDYIKKFPSMDLNKPKNGGKETSPKNSGAKE